MDAWAGAYAGVRQTQTASAFCGQRQRVALARSLAKRPKLLRSMSRWARWIKSCVTGCSLKGGYSGARRCDLRNGYSRSGRAMTMAGRIAIMNRGKFVQIASRKRSTSIRPPATALNLSVG